jgi:predicted ATP-binding protein involved in virulence
MKIKNLIPSSSLRANGLVFKEMRDLKQVVALFGKNGSGKSRLLKYLPNEISMATIKLNDVNQKIKQHLRRLEANQLAKDQSSLLAALIEQKNQLSTDLEMEEGDSILIISGRGQNILSAENMHDGEYRNGTLHLVSNPDFTQVKQNCAKFIKSLCRSEMAKDYHEKHEGKKHYIAQDEIQSKNTQIFKLLQEVVQQIMGKKLDYSVDEHLTPIVRLDGRPLTPGELSDGERELLAYCTFLVLQRQDEITNKTLSLKGKIILLDEVELFLHPKAQIDLITGLRRLVGPNGQIWLATHSLAILSILDRDEIWFMENGDIISPSIETPNKVLSSLVGEENIDALENFISSQYEWASIQFALESLFSPSTAEYKENDIQQNQVKERLLSASGEVKILDFGAGKGRIAQEIIRNPDLARNIYYQPLEVNEETYETLADLTARLQQMSSIDNSTEREILDNHEKLNEKQYSEMFDYVLLINVLHEIPLRKWNSVLNSILNCLKVEGQIIILEDQAIPRGENAHEYGFLIFNIEEFKILFSRANLPKSHKHPNPKYKNRLTCIEIPKSKSLVNSNSIIEALSRKKSNCKTAINKLKAKKSKTPKDGRENSFLTQLYANVDMALEDFKK